LLQGRLQYILPDNISPLISALFGQNLRQDERLSSSSLSEYSQFIKLKECVKEMSEFIKQKPNWFALSHSKITTIVDEREEKGEEKGRKEEERIKIEENSEMSEEEEISSEKRKDTVGESSGSSTTAKLDSGIFDWTGGNEEEMATSNSIKVMSGELQKQTNNWYSIC